MEILHPKIVFNQQGQPTEVVISWQEYQYLIETSKLDLKSEVRMQLNQDRHRLATMKPLSIGFTITEEWLNQAKADGRE